jgi:hypothetical protein
MKLYAVAWSFVKGNTYFVDSTFEVAIGKEDALGHSLMRLQENYPVSDGYTGHAVSACLIPDKFIDLVTQNR